jgi:L-asparagine oxygenase
MATVSEGNLPAPISLPSLELTGQERDELGLVATQLACLGPGIADDVNWIAAARRLSCQVPVRLRETIRQYRHDCGPEAFLAIRNLPVDVAALPATPTVRDSVERRTTVPASVIALLASQLGEMISFRDEKLGALVQNVVPVPGMEASQSNAGSVDLEMHVENAFHRSRPDYVTLLCLRGDYAGAAGTTVSSIRRALPLMPEHARRVLAEPRFVTQPPPSFRESTATPVHPVLMGNPADPDVRIDLAATVALDEEAGQAMEQLRDAFTLVAVAVVMRSGDLVFIDNRLALHGRSSFVPRYDGNDRWLHRSFVHLDSRRGRADQFGESPVLN